MVCCVGRILSSDLMQFKTIFEDPKFFFLNTVIISGI